VREHVEWKGGVHVIDTPLWCDALHARESCFISHAGVPEAHRHRQIICTAETLALLTTTARRKPQATLTPPYSRPFSLGDVRVELFPTGFLPGAAGLLVETAGTRVAYLGSIAPGVGAPAWPAQLRPADVLVVDGSFVHARFRFPPREQALAELDAQVARALADGATPVVLAAPLTLAPVVAARLAARGPLVAHRSIVDAARQLRAVGRESAPMKRVAGAPAAGEIVLWPPGLRHAPALAGLRKARVILADGSALDAAAVARLRVDAAVPLTDRAGHDDLREIIAQTGARQVYLVGGEDADAQTLARGGVTVGPLGPPRQLEMF
jgi:hypothetical protein